MHFHDCAYEPEIPLFLVLCGSGLILKTGIFVIKTFLKRSSSEDNERKTLHTCDDILSLFLVLWWITGKDL